MDLIDYLIDDKATIIDALKQLDRTAKKILFVVKEDQFVATITDGDIRRWILRKGDLEAEVNDVANHNPKFIFESEKSNAMNCLEKYGIEAVPILNSNRKVVSIVFRHDGAIEKRGTLDLPVVIMAGGLGTRLYPYTKILPKPLIPIGEIPIVEHIMNRFHKYGCSKFFLVVNHKKNMIKAYFNEIEKDYTVDYADEEIPLGTGGGLSLLKNKIKSTFVLTNCDILIQEDYEKIYKFHKIEGNLITMVCSLKHIKIPYGVIEIGESGEIASMREKPELSFFTNTGMYIVEPKVIAEMEEKQSIGFPDIIQKYKDAGEKIGVFPISEYSWMDMGQLDEMEEMRKRLEKDG